MNVERLHLRDYETAEELWSLQLAAYRVEAAAIGVADLPPLLDTIASLRGSGETFWGCRNEEGELVGAVSAKEAESVVTICRVMVHPEYFRQGIGKRLLEHVLNLYADAGRFELSVERRNGPAIGLYRKLGFVPYGKIEPLPDISLVRMVKERGKQP
ncbi:GNAT family N-acetyltransferase [Cohnella massiliensis]|uniref:GNAT family N-acetyltransferase n=1 Tax=Cohnella massiliensis TaxID=1816691 RepID=UPI0009BBB719|nr:GNAT family N-acetyltransferase [Cohnella massiliensis]